ncbi:PREDICTED: uncharacterized protein LOC107069001 [Polistes dominula]|uniref:Uncharacterized protein LOC107069001 n=1 Tax=Polistes dominula TaxID=743375 RepID=A0ABM1IME8_POLDO|nr:PREDICTED: uncharacterized protein LOC107069001 [Polistes dominula]
MKTVFIILATIFVSCHGFVYKVDAQESNIETYDEIPVDKLREIMRNGSSALGIPVLDPFKLRQTEYIIREKGFLEAQGYLRNMQADNLSNFVAIKADYTIIGLKINLHLKWDSIKLVTDYSIIGNLGDMLSIYGLGEIDATAQGLELNVTMGLSIKDNGDLFVRSFESGIKLKALDIKITGLFHDEPVSKIVSTILSDMIPQLIDDYQQELTGKFNTLATNTINKLLKGKTLWDLISIISPSENEPIIY